MLLGSLPQSPVPVEREPQHRPVFENASLRLLDVVLPSSYVSLFHTHSNDNVSVRLATGPTRVDLPGADGLIQTPPVGRVVFNSAHPPYTHRVANVGDHPIRIFDVELLTPIRADAAPATPAGAPGHEVVVDNTRVLASRIVLRAGERMPAHRHSGGWLEVVVTGSEPGRFLWHDPGSTASAIDATVDTQVVEIEVR
ncbi:MAG: hypothetical protein ABI051_14500 [Vicinamibacterales bacterium]